MLSDADTRVVTTPREESCTTSIRRFRRVSACGASLFASLGSRRINQILIGFFGIVALLLATAGVFGG